jgi:hypothetical protein
MSSTFFVDWPETKERAVTENVVDGAEQDRAALLTLTGVDMLEALRSCRP